MSVENQAKQSPPKNKKIQPRFSFKHFAEWVTKYVLLGFLILAIWNYHEPKIEINLALYVIASIALAAYTIVKFLLFIFGYRVPEYGEKRRPEAMSKSHYDRFWWRIASDFIIRTVTLLLSVAFLSQLLIPLGPSDLVVSCCNVAKAPTGSIFPYLTLIIVEILSPFNIIIDRVIPDSFVAIKLNPKSDVTLFFRVAVTIIFVTIVWTAMKEAYVLGVGATDTKLLQERFHSITSWWMPGR